ncbi:MAG: hypothetical protein ACLVJH_13620 [Faecalibacterium prausnitzii]
MCIGYCLMASLIVALTVVPAASATVLKNAQPKKLAWFDKIQDAYGRSLEKALKTALYRWQPPCCCWCSAAGRWSPWASCCCPPAPVTRP